MTLFLGSLLFIYCTLISVISAKPDPEICEKYEVVEQKFKCGPDGYPLHFGLRNCLMFNNQSTLDKFTPKGRKFVGCSTNCLVKAIVNISEYSTSCTQIQEEAFKSHVDCYLNCNFCEVCKTEKLAFLGSYDWTDFLSYAAVKQVLAIIRKCGIFSCLKVFDV
ncbi:DUF19 domain-containing protein [Caenorhabditis elegans]|uniref:DUF19 domain-containing protein n=2 Tax=Caenorhabditis elegans TaxID=6239 RepID=Q09EE8_CAEEL|nr:DUF19 domain-containing protein [Caenorhabditis elegans]CAL44974.1 DUF19 domain-containing protein [Caenorhabditis elegans]|eukprot:NP_001076617.1 Uncharacterized protein CELE_W01A8.8 [Caenorhabditis elegans]